MKNPSDPFRSTNPAPAQILLAMDGHPAPRRKSHLVYVVCFVLVSALVIALLWATMSPAKKRVLASVDLGDGRILQIEGLTYGLKHKIGDASSTFLDRFRPWLPNKLGALLQPKYPQNSIDYLNRPSLVVWLNAIDAVTRTNVDCQQIRVELVDHNGDLYETDTSHWFGGQTFWRSGQVFGSFPRTEEKLTMLVTSWKNKKTSRVEFPNPYLSQPAAWTAAELPQEKRAGDYSIVLATLKLRTNGNAKTSFWETKSVYWNPVWEVRRDGQKVSGWSKPEWMAEDPTGNHSQHLSPHQPMLRFATTFYPVATNAAAATLIATLPETAVTNLSSPVWWNRKFNYGTNEILALGFFPPGSYVFSDGILLTNSPVKMGPTSGGAPSGWTGQSQRVTPLLEKYYHGHYSISNSIIYLRAPTMDGKERLAVRLRDARGKYFSARAEPQGGPDGVFPFLVKLPPDTTNLVPEVVVLKPLEAEFTVKTPALAAPAPVAK